MHSDRAIRRRGLQAVLAIGVSALAVNVIGVSDATYSTLTAIAIIAGVSYALIPDALQGRRTNGR